ncbi:hypothetical protein [Lutibacter sp.]|uniref:hypothetical protein n=1 Tax=Lutibacter sp. TaxID=1925666 RepID=UPI001A1FEACA|nr:hypothetical protein [Lutibacter sp.]MBI9039819.1 hypothetical protein [Lutibacter sp.]
MFNLNESIIFEYQNEHVLEHDFQVKKNYSNPKIYDSNGDLSKRWYVYFSYRNPETGKLKRITPFYGEANKHKTKSDRMFVLAVYKHKIKELLKRGYNPFEKNAELFQKEQAALNTANVAIVEKNVLTPIVEKVAQVSPIVATNAKTIAEAFEFSLNLKKKLVKEITLKAYTSKSTALQQFIATNYPEVKYIDQLTKSIVVQFLNSILENLLMKMLLRRIL